MRYPSSPLFDGLRVPVWIRAVGLALGIATVCAVAADTPSVIEKTALAYFTAGRTDEALAYVDAQISAATPAAKDLAVSSQLSRLAVILYSRRDRARAAAVGRLACARAEARLADAALTPAHFSLCREQFTVCDTILRDVAASLARVECALRYIGQAGRPADLDPAREELERQRTRLLQQQKIISRPN